MKVLLVQPPDLEGKRILRDHAGRFGVESFKYDLLPPLNFASAASVLEKEGFEVEILDCSALNFNLQRLLKKTSEINPDLIIVNTAGISKENDLGVAAKLKEKTGKFTGVIIPFEPPYLEEIFEKKIDVAIRGEIEYTVLDIAKGVPLEKIKGIIFKKRNKIVKNPPRELIKNLDELPIPAYHLLPMKKYSYWYMPKKPFTTVFTSRGCPFNCSYCPYPIGFGNVWRGKSIENVLKELKFLKEKYGIKSVLFRDQIFTFDMKRAEEICDRIIEEDLDIRWRCETRVDRLSKELMRKMKKAGCEGMHLGIESGDPKLLNSIAKKGLNPKKIKNIFHEAREIGIATRAFFIIGLPGDTKETINKTFKLAEEIDADDYFFNAVVPYPGTKLYEEAKRKGWILEEDWEKLVVSEAVMRNEKLSQEDIHRFVELANERFRKNGMNLKSLFTKRTIEAAISDPKLAIEYLLKKTNQVLSKVLS